MGVSCATPWAPPPAPRTSRAYASFQQTTRSTAGDLSRLRPPPNLAGAHQQLVSALQAIAAGSQAVIDAGRTGDRSRVLPAVRAFQSRLNGSLGPRAQDAATRIDAGLAQE